MWKEHREGWTGSGRRERCVQVCQRIWATVDTTIKQSGVQVREDPQLYMHAKIIVVDNKVAFVGSENISTQSLDQNGVLARHKPRRLNGSGEACAGLSRVPITAFAAEKKKTFL